MVRVRFAPSPTGFLHVGSARTALFNWLFARHEKGEFLVRVEDTDQTRSNKEFLDEILDSLKWLGMDWDGELVFQSKRLDIYKKYAKELLDKGAAYESEGAVFFKIPDEKIKITDLIRGPIEFDSKVIKDQVMIKSDGFPTYNFACVIDDADMSITHVIRGDDHISNTPKQVPMYKALGFKPPQFAHIPLIMGADGGRLSKRHGATSLSEYRDMGYLPDALRNFIALMGWSPGENKEMASLDEMVKSFDIKNVVKTAAVFDINKCAWMNGQYIKEMELSKLVDLIIPLLKEKKLITEEFDQKKLTELVALYKERIRTLPDLCNLAEFFFKDDFTFDEKGVNKHLKKEGASGILLKLKERFESSDKFDVKSIEDTTRSLADELKIKAAAVIHPARMALTGRTVGAGLFETIEILGKEKTLKRLQDAAEKFK
ncbi:MAG: glutamate--tRNA ligase [Candidatus Omnitrophica bacterium]|nr:glutamate--tRNA ligase [Candidatus Omnitrophota bacterium]